MQPTQHKSGVLLHTSPQMKTILHTEKRPTLVKNRTPKGFTYLHDPSLNPINQSTLRQESGAISNIVSIEPGKKAKKRTPLATAATAATERKQLEIEP